VCNNPAEVETYFHRVVVESLIMVSLFKDGSVFAKSFLSPTPLTTDEAQCPTANDTFVLPNSAGETRVLVCPEYGIDITA
jgi:hypothetical protein